MAISNINPVDTAVVQPGDSFSFDIDDTYTSIVIYVNGQTAYSSAVGGVQAGFTVTVVDDGAGTHTFTVSESDGFSVEPTTIKVVEDETGSSATTEFTYYLTATAVYPEGMQPYNSPYTGDLKVTEGDADRGNDTGWLDFDATDFNVTDLGNGKRRVETVSGAGSGDVEGPASATDDAIAVFDGTTGKLIKNSTGTIAQITANTAKVSYTDAAKVAGIEAGATADQDDTEVLLNGIIGSPTYTTLKQGIDNFHSAGVFTGGNVTDDGDGTITVSAGTGMIRATDSDVAPLLSFDWAAEAGANVALTTNSMNYIYVEYNAGAPQIVATTTKRTDFNTNIELATVYRYTGSDIHITDNQYIVADHAGKMIQRLEEVAGLTYETGSIVSEVGTRNISVTAGKWWIGLVRSDTPAVDTSVAGTFNYYYSDGAGGFTEVTGQTTIDNLQYDDGSGTLATLASNQYGAHFVYVAQDGDIYVVYGTDSYTAAGAAEAPAPGSLPPHFAEHHARVAARITIQKSAATFTAIDSAFTQLFNASAAADHGGLGGLGDDDHTQYALVDGTRAFTGLVTVDDSLTLTGVDSDLTIREHTSAPGTPSTGYVNVYAKADGLLYSKDDAGVETLVSGGTGGGGGVYGYGTWAYDAGATTGSAIAAGEFRLNNANPTSATVLYIRKDNQEGVNLGTILEDAGGYRLSFWNADGTEGFVCDLGTPSDLSTYWQFPISNVVGDTSLVDAASFGVTFIAPSVSPVGDVVGPAGATDSAVALFDGTTGKLIKNGSTLSVDGFGNLIATQEIQATGELQSDTGTTVKEVASHVTPAAGYVAVYAKADGLLYSKDDAGTETLITGGGGGGSGSLTLASYSNVAVDATEVVIGGGYIDGSTGGTYSWNATWIYNDGGGASTQDAELRLYNDAGLKVSTLLLDSSVVGLDTLTNTNQALTAGATPTLDGDIILNSTDIYEVRLYITATGAVDSVTVLSCEFVEA